MSQSSYIRTKVESSSQQINIEWEKNKTQVNDSS